MKRRYVEKSFTDESLRRIQVADQIVAKYLKQGLVMTLRQLYYQFVANHNYPNTERSYQNLSRLIADARLAGRLDWDAIEDRGRTPSRASQFDNVHDVMAAALGSYRLPRWDGQESYAELWVEKQALAGVLSPVARKFHAVLMVNKGYSSISAMHESAERFIEAMKYGHKNLYVFYLGDHDPSGEDMVRDVRDRLALFGAELKVEKIALTMDQVRQYNPPPNPAKVSDARFAAYAAKYGTKSWEVDALEPALLQRTISGFFESVIDKKKMDEIIAAEELDKAKIRSFIDQLPKREQRQVVVDLSMRPEYDADNDCTRIGHYCIQTTGVNHTESGMWVMRGNIWVDEHEEDTQDFECEVKIRGPHAHRVRKKHETSAGADILSCVRVDDTTVRITMVATVTCDDCDEGEAWNAQFSTDVYLEKPA